MLLEQGKPIDLKLRQNEWWSEYKEAWKCYRL